MKQRKREWDPHSVFLRHCPQKELRPKNKKNRRIKGEKEGKERKSGRQRNELEREKEGKERDPAKEEESNAVIAYRKRSFQTNRKQRMSYRKSDGDPHSVALPRERAP